MPSQPRAATPGKSLRHPLGFLAAFVLAYGVGHHAYFSIPDEVLRDTVIHFGMVAPSAWFLDLLAPAEQVMAEAHRLVSPRATLEVVRGCDGIGTALLVAAAILAFPASLRRKALGLALGLVLVYAVNLARMVGLYFVVAYRNDWFPLLHGYVVPIAFVAIVAAFFLWWVSREMPTAAAGAAVS